MRLLSARIKIHQILVLFETTNQFFSKFCINSQCHEKQLLYTFLTGTLYTFNKRRLSRSKFGEIESLKFGTLMGYFHQNNIKFHLLWHGRVMRSLKKNWLVWFQILREEFCEFSPNHSKVQKFHFDRLFLSKVYEVWAKKIRRSYLSWQWTVMQNLNKPCYGLKIGMRNWVNFH